MDYKIFLDDERFPDWVYKTNNDDWVIIRNLTDFKNTILERGIPDFISFDNDLGASLEEGMDAVKWMVYEMEFDISNMDFNVHSANSGGPGGPKGNIASLLNNWKKELVRRKEGDTNKLRKEVRKILTVAVPLCMTEKMQTLKESINRQKDTLTAILNALEFKKDILAAGGEIYAVGGIVRDAIMGKPSDDLDIVIRGVPYDKLFAILSKYGNTKDTSFVDENGKKDFGATKFVSFNKTFNQLLANNGIRKDIDVMLPRKDMKVAGEKGHRSIKSDVNPMFTIYDDLKRRDITINAIALDINGKIIDNGTGLKDIQNGIIRAVSEDAFIEDPLRMIRAIRFAARFNYKWDENTLNLIRKNAHLLADKSELPRERFLMEFQKMIGKADLGRAVKLLIELGLYKAMFGVEPTITDYKKFDKAKNVAEFSFMLFENEPHKNILPLIEKHITKTTDDLEYVDALIKYIDNIKGKNLDLVTEINQLANIYNISPEILLNSSYVDSKHRAIAQKFKSGELPRGDHDIDFKGGDFRGFVIDTIKASGKEFNERIDSAKMGKAKRLAIQAIYSGILENNKEAIKKYLLNNLESWMN